VCEVDPEVPVTVTVAVPVVAEEEAVRVRVDVPLPFAGGVTGFVEKEAVTPEGRPEAARVTAELKPLELATVIVLVPLEPWVMLTEVGEAETANAGAAVTVRVTVALWVVEPLVPVTVTV
jgi:hypothetical protein